MIKMRQQLIGLLLVFEAISGGDCTSGTGGIVEEGEEYSYKLKASEFFSLRNPFAHDEKNFSSNFEIKYNGELKVYSSSPKAGTSYSIIAVHFSRLNVSVEYLPSSSSDNSANKALLYNESLTNMTECYTVSNSSLIDSNESSRKFHNLVMMLFPNLNDHLEKENCKRQSEIGSPVTLIVCEGGDNLMSKIFTQLSSFPIFRELLTQFNFPVGVISTAQSRMSEFYSLKSTTLTKLLNHTSKSTFLSNNNICIDSSSLNFTNSNQDEIPTKERDLLISKSLNNLFANFGTNSSNAEDFMSIKRLLAQLKSFEYLNTSLLGKKGMNVFLSAAAEIGTDSSIKFLCDKIKNNKLDDLITLQFYKNLRFVKNIGESGLDSLASLVKLKTPGIGFLGPKRPPFLTTQLFLGASYVANSYCNNINSSACTYAAARDSIVDYIAENVNFDVHEEHLKFALLALGNLQQLTPTAINAIESVLIGEKTSNALKTIALATISQSGSARLRKIAREILNDATNPEDIRVHAYLSLFESEGGFTQEEVKVISEIFNRNDTKISYFIGTHLHGIANSALPSVRSAISNHELINAINLSNEDSQAQRLSHFMELSYYNEDLQMGLSLSITVAFSSGCRQPIYLILKLIVEIAGVRYDPIEVRLNQRFFLNPESYYSESEPTDWMSVWKSLSSKFTYIRSFNQTISCDLPSSSKFTRQKWIGLKTIKFGFTKSTFSLMNVISSFSLFDFSLNWDRGSFFGIPITLELSSAAVVAGKADAEGNPLTNGMGFLTSGPIHLSGQANFSTHLSLDFNGRISLGGNAIIFPVSVGREIKLSWDNLLNLGIDDLIFGKEGGESSNSKKKSINVGINFSFPSEKVGESNFSLVSRPFWKDNFGRDNSVELTDNDDNDKPGRWSRDLENYSYCHETSEVCLTRETSGKLMKISRKLEMKNPSNKGMFINVTLSKFDLFSVSGSFYNKTEEMDGEQSVQGNILGSLELSAKNKKWFEMVYTDASVNENPIVSVAFFQDEVYSHVDGKFNGPLKNLYLNSSKSEVVRTFPDFSEWQCSDEVSLNGNASIELQRKVLSQTHNQSFSYSDLEGNSQFKPRTSETSRNSIKSWTLLIKDGQIEWKLIFSKKLLYCDNNTAVGVCNFWSNGSSNGIGSIRDYEISFSDNAEQKQQHRITYRKETVPRFVFGKLYFTGVEIDLPLISTTVRLTMDYEDRKVEHKVSRFSTVAGYYGNSQVGLISLHFPRFPKCGELDGTLVHYGTFNSSFNFTDHPFSFSLSYASLSGDYEGSFKVLADKAILMEEGSYSWRNGATGEYANVSNKLSIDFYKGRVDNKGTRSYKTGSRAIDPNAYNATRNAGWGIFFLAVFGFITIVLLVLNASRKFMSSGRCRYSFNNGHIRESE